MKYDKRFYVVSLPLSPNPKELHIWSQQEVQLCCGDIKIHFASDNENECTEFRKSVKSSMFYDAWKSENGDFDILFPKK